MKNQTSNWNYLADSFCPLSRNKLDRHAIVTTKIVRRTLTPERAMSGALFAGTRCQVWPTAPQPLPCLATTSSAGWQPNQLEPLKLGGGPPAVVERKIRLAKCKVRGLVLLLLLLVHFAKAFLAFFPAREVHTMMT